MADEQLSGAEPAAHRVPTAADEAERPGAAAPVEVPTATEGDAETEAKTLAEGEIASEGKTPTEGETVGEGETATDRETPADGEDEAETPAGGTGVTGVTLSVAFTIGVTVTKWTRLWAERHPELPLHVFRSEPGEQTAVLQTKAADVSFVRHPIDQNGLSVIALYSEVPVVGVAKDHPASVFDVVPVAELGDEHLLQDPDEVPEWRDLAAEVADGSRRPLRGIQSLGDAVEQVAAGVGIVIVPQSISRLHNRKDVVFRPVSGVAETQVSLAWREGDPSALVEEFIGIVRGRSASSSRGGGAVAAAAVFGVPGAGAAGAMRATASDAPGGRASAPAKKIGPVAKAKAKARAAKEAEDAAAIAQGRRPKPGPARKKTQSDQANAAQARRRKFGGKR
ncbi:MAG: LysR family transcriptional regulator [Subtercola sp.]|nr:LysR family transcriptional regulator [Subtercola sp.]